MPILDAHTLDFWSHSPEQTVRFGARLGELLRPGDLLGLSGELGAGKTTFVGGLSRGWGSSDQVTSPTFVLVNEYRRPDGLRLWHLDSYRLNSGQEALALGLDDLLAGDGLVVVEWPERIADVLPAERLHVELAWVDHSRRSLRLGASGERYFDVVEQFRRAAFT
jgi:tRNA threonylcarbamoyladenosine biosynthesis protein TsaE